MKTTTISTVHNSFSTTHMISLTLAVCIIIILILYWAKNFANLMSKDDESFVSTYDKYIWIVILILLSIPGAVAFHFWNNIVERRMIRINLENKLEERKQKRNLNKVGRANR